MKGVLKTAVFAWITCLAAAQLYAADIELTDGSLIRGEIVSMDENTVVVNSGGLGEMTIDTERIRNLESLRAIDSASKNRARNPYVSTRALTAARQSMQPRTEDIEALQDRMLKDPRMLDSIMSLSQNPEFQRLLEDPDIVEAARQGNMTALMENQKLLEAAADPVLQDVAIELTQPQQ